MRRPAQRPHHRCVSGCRCECVNSDQRVRCDETCDERLTGRVCVAHVFYLEVQDLGRGNCKHSFLSISALWCEHVCTHISACPAPGAPGALGRVKVEAGFHTDPDGEASEPQTFHHKKQESLLLWILDSYLMSCQTSVWAESEQPQASKTGAFHSLSRFLGNQRK